MLWALYLQFQLPLQAEINHMQVSTMPGRPTLCKQTILNQGLVYLCSKAVSPLGKDNMVQSHPDDSSHGIFRRSVSPESLSPGWNFPDNAVEIFQQQAVTKKRHLTYYQKCISGFDFAMIVCFPDRGLAAVCRTCSPAAPSKASNLNLAPGLSASSIASTSKPVSASQCLLTYVAFRLISMWYFRCWF